MKKILTATSIFLIALTGFAQEGQNAFLTIKDNPVVSDFNFYLDTRYDLNTKFGPHYDNQSGFQVNKTRIYLTTKVKDKFQVFLRYNLNAAADAKALEFAFLEYTINKNWAVSAGQLITAWGTFEIDYNGADIYNNTTLLDDLEVYAPGVNLAYMFNNQRFNLQITSASNQFATAAYVNKAYAYMFLWQGSFFQDKFTTRYGYGLMQHDSSKYYNWITLGNRLVIDRWFAELEWIYGFRNINFDPTSTLTGPLYDPTYVKENAVALSLKYHFDNWNPYFKAIYNKRDALDQDAAFSLLSLQGAFEYYPFKEDPLFKDIRLFAAYTYNLTTYKKQVANLADINQHQVLAGVRWLIPIAKSSRQDSNYKTEIEPYL